MSAPEVLGHLTLTCIVDGILHGRIEAMPGKTDRILGKYAYAVLTCDEHTQEFWEFIELVITDTPKGYFGPVQTLDELPVVGNHKRPWPQVNFDVGDLEYIKRRSEKRNKEYWWIPVRTEVVK